MNELVVPTDEIALSVSGSEASVRGEDSIASLSGDAVSVPVSVDDAEASLSADSVIVIHEGEVPYTGRYTFTPSEETQTVSIQGKTASRDIIINPIPNNYGLITWNGAILTVS